MIIQPVAHRGLEFTNEELLQVLVAERLDRLADRMVRRGAFRLGVYGRRAHHDWLHANIHGMRAFPIAAYIDGPDNMLMHDPRATYRAVEVLAIDDHRLPMTIDAVLISDDRFEDALHEHALRMVPPGMIVHRLYDRLCIGNERPDAPTIVSRRVAPGTHARAGDAHAIA